jgi:Thin aggregative fimbriae synthesis protein
VARLCRPGTLQVIPLRGYRSGLKPSPAVQGRRVVLPYVKSLQAMQVHYSVEVETQGAGGASRASQQGTIAAPENKKTLLTRVTLGLRPQDDCRIELVLDDPVALRQLGRYSFKCR